MDISKIKIVADSSADLPTVEGVAFASAPLKIITAEKEYIDHSVLNVEEMVDDLSRYGGKSSTACPAPGDWLNAFGSAEYVFCVTLTGTLSGSYNSACIAKKEYEESYPGRRVFVIDSLSAGPELRLIIDKLHELINAGKPFDEICSAINKYRKKTALIFMLESMKNLANNGRVSPFIAKAAGLLGIRVVGKASDKGDLEPIDKCRGEKNALSTMLENMKKLGMSGGKVAIGHCFNEKAATALKEMIISEFKNVKVEIYRVRGLCSFYAEKGGILIGFERAATV